VNKTAYGVLISTLLMSAAPSAAPFGDNQNFLRELQAHNAQRQSGPVGKLTGPQLQLREQDMAWAGQMKNQLSAAVNPQEKPLPQVVYLVSFSIPEEGLNRMLVSAHRFAIPVAVNGLIDNNFRRTVQAVYRLSKETGQGGVQVDPRPFTRYGITAAPALVVTCGDKHDVLRGNLRIEAALEKIAEEGDCANVAQGMLAAHKKQQEAGQ